MDDVDEAFYVVKNDRNHFAAKTVPEIHAGPFFDRIEAERNCPEDEDGFEYNVESLMAWEAEEKYR